MWTGRSPSVASRGSASTTASRISRCLACRSTRAPSRYDSAQAHLMPRCACYADRMTQIDEESELANASDSVSLTVALPRDLVERLQALAPRATGGLNGL